MEKINRYLKKLIDKGLFHIFGSSVLNKIILFLNNAIIVRVISQADYGAYSYANNIVSIILLFNGLGVTSGILQYCSSNLDDSKKRSLEKFSYRLGIVVNFILSCVICFVSLIIELPIPHSNQLLLLLSLMPICSFTFEMITIVLRTKLENKRYSYLATINTIVTLLSTIGGGLTVGISGIIILRYIGIFIPILLGLKWLKGDIKESLKAKNIDKTLKNDFMKFSIVSVCNNALSQILYLIDIFLIGLLIKDSSLVATYKTATLIPFTLNFIPISLMTFVYPYFVRNKNNNKWFKKNTFLIVGGLAILNFLISISLMIFAPFIIRLLFGEKYLGAVQPFRILAFGYFVAGTFRIPLGNILVILKKLKFSLFVTVGIGIINVILDYIMISRYGIMGASVTVVTIYILSSLMSGGYILYTIKKNDKK